MEKYFNILKRVTLFDTIDEDNLSHVLKCLDAKLCVYSKDNIIFLTDDAISQVGIVLSGTIQVVKEDYLGNRTILTELSCGDIFGETFACAGIKKSPVTVLAITGCEVIFIDYKKIFSNCSSTCIFHTKLIENMLKLLANKNLMLNQKIEIVSKRTTREKLMTYFSVQMQKTNNNKFNISFTRNQLADYLCVNSSSMSRELCKMRDESLINFEGNYFEIL